MKFTEIELQGAFIIDMEPNMDNRGFFARAWCQKEFEKIGLKTSFVQANLAGSTKRGILRGMHYQVAPYGEAKLIRCLKGKIFDVMVDLRNTSPTYMKWASIELSEEEHFRMIYVPEGFAHGYLTLCDDSEIFYIVSEFYAPDAERGIRWNDPAVGIKWPITEDLIISEKDQNWSLINE